MDMVAIIYYAMSRGAAEIAEGTVGTPCVVATRGHAVAAGDATSRVVRDLRGSA